jgi:DNA-binding NtrC family response regulator
VQHTVLLVGDDASALDGLRRALRAESCHVVVAESATAAFEAVAGTPVDVIVADMEAPGVPGSEFLAQLASMAPTSVRLILAPNDALATVADAVDGGLAHRFFLRPWNAVDLAVTVRHALERRDLLAESRRLLHAVRRQAAVMEELDREVRGLDRRSRDPAGEVALTDVPSDPVELLTALERELDATEARLREQEREMRRRSEPAAPGARR